VKQKERIEMSRVVVSAILLSLLHTPVLAQWFPWAEDAFGERGSGRYERTYPSFEAQEERQRPLSGLTQDGGPRPLIIPQAPPLVAFPYNFAAASIVIDTSARKLYYVLAEGRAYQYPISVGREGFNWTGTETISRKQAWPDWHPPEEMRQRDPKLPEKMTGGSRNPLGAMALYLGDSLYRIHGTNDVKSIGQAQSSGCFRMMNSAVLHLAGLTEIGTNVTVVNRLPPAQEMSRAPEPPAPLLSQEARQSVLQSGSPSDRQESQVPTAAPRSLQDYRALREHMMAR
jgi:lipoprotein-anchoring transpeptidase ErfK/SrfK